jgi:hypothetical protein
MTGHPKMLPAQPGINAPRTEWIDINALDATDPVHLVNYKKRLPDDQFDFSQFSEENGDGPIY